MKSSGFQLHLAENRGGGRGRVKSSSFQLHLAEKGGRGREWGSVGWIREAG